MLGIKERSFAPLCNAPSMTWCRPTTSTENGQDILFFEIDPDGVTRFIVM